MSRKSVLFAVAMSLTLVLVCAAGAQTGSITGTVSDSSGAVVRGAAITVRNTDTGAVRTAISGDTGLYSVTNLAVGKYEIEVSGQSFASFRLSGIALTVDQILTANAVLKPGASTEEVSVNAIDLPPLDLESSQVSNVVESKQMQDLPLILRDPYQLMLLSPGLIQSNTGFGGFSVNGSSERDNNFLLDGVDNNDTSVPGAAGGITTLNPDATEEFRVITNNFMPEFGRNNGAIVDVVTKSGTNDFHGTSYWFGRYNALGARDYFNHNPDQLDPSKTEPMNPYVRNIFGFSVGGPVYKNKTFFFVNSDWQRFRTALTENAIVPTAAFKTGVFTFNGVPVNLADPNSQQNFQGLSLDPATLKLLLAYPDPTPNAPAVDDVRGLYYFPSKSQYNGWYLTTKIDQHFTDSETAHLRVAYDTSSDPDSYHDEFLTGLGATGYKAHVSNVGLGLTSTLKSTLVNDVRLGFNKTNFPFYCGNVGTIDGFGPTDLYGRGRDYNLPGIASFGCITTLGDSDSQSRATGTWSIADGLSWVKGPHTAKFGAEYRFVFEDGYDNFSSRDAVTFSGFTNFGSPSFNI